MCIFVCASHVCPYFLVHYSLSLSLSLSLSARACTFMSVRWLLFPLCACASFCTRAYMCLFAYLHALMRVCAFMCVCEHTCTPSESVRLYVCDYMHVCLCPHAPNLWCTFALAAFTSLGWCVEIGSLSSYYFSLCTD